MLTTMSNKKILPTQINIEPKYKSFSLINHNPNLLLIVDHSLENNFLKVIPMVHIDPIGHHKVLFQ